MSKHDKHTVIPTTRFQEAPGAYNLWALLNPEYADDDIVVAREMEEMEAEAEMHHASDVVDAHGFNGHDPREEESPLERFSFYDDPFDDDGFYDDRLDYDAFDDDDHSRAMEDERIDRELQAEAEELESRTAHLLKSQSLRMGVREKSKIDPRWHRDERKRKKLKRPSRPFVKDWHKSA